MFSVIIPTFDRSSLLSKCLDTLSISYQSILSWKYEVIVSDDSLNELTKKLIEDKYSWVKHVYGPKRGPAANRNNGAKHASGQWFIFIDDDCICEKDILKNYQDAIINNPDEQVYEGMIIPNDWNLLKKDLSECPINLTGNCFWSANICIKSSLMEKIGGFDEEYLIAAHEDQQMKIDIEGEIEHPIRFLTRCKVIHPVRIITMKEKIKRIPRISKNFALFSYKNKHILHKNSLFKFIINQYYSHLKSTVKFLLSGSVKSSILSLIYLFYAIPLNVLNYLQLSKNIKN